MRKHSAFTLAEVLITLGIIGVVAAMTIPTLMTGTNKSEFRTGFKKILSMMNQAVTMSVAVDYLDFADADQANTGDHSVFRILSDRMHIVKTAENSDEEITKMFGSTGGSNYTLFFADGMVLSYPKTMTTCTWSRARQNCTAIVDVNGIRNPNRLSHCQYSAEGGGQSSVVSDATATAASGGTSGSAVNGICSESNAYISDQYSIIFRGQQVLPNGYAARFVLYNN